MSDNEKIEPIRLGVAGAGLAVRELHWPALRALAPRYEIVALAARREESRRKTGELVGCDTHYSDYREMIEAERDNLDAVLVSMPIDKLYEASAAAARAGLDVLSEKPVGGTIEEGRAFAALPAETGVSVQILENFRHRDDLLRAQRLIKEGRIGDPYMLRLHAILHTDPDAGGFAGTPWRMEGRYEAGPLLDNGVHHMAAIQLLGGPAVRAGGVITEPRGEYEGVDTALLTFEFENGAIGTYIFSNNSIQADGEQSYFELRVYGTTGTMLTKDDGWTGIFTEGGVEWLPAEGDRQGYYNEFLDFYRHKREGAPLRVPPAAAFQDLSALLTAVRGAREGCMLEVATL